MKQILEELNSKREQSSSFSKSKSSSEQEGKQLILENAKDEGN